MLILTRKVGETIRIGEAVTVRVLEVRGSQVRLGIEAPPDVRIFREEVWLAMRAEQVDGEADASAAAPGRRLGKPPAA
jgi:carbon storage regulator